jgi:tRNA (adenine37-N6)-methyltransferase
MHNRADADPSTIYAMQSIGSIRTPFLKPEGTPIQAAVANGAEGVIELHPAFTAGLCDLEGFERLWLIYLLDRIASVELLPIPFLDKEQHGIFATRSPARPNHIGMSSVRLLRIEGNRIFIADADMLDRTPLLDIKPYVPAFDVFAVSRIGWYRGKTIEGAVADDRFSAR